MKTVKYGMIALAAVAILVCAPLAAGNASGYIVFNGRTYTPTLIDEFDYLDFGKWSYCPEMERQDAGGEWRNACSTVEDGKLVITCAVAEDGTPISGGLRSRSAYEQTFGLYHMRFKMEYADGLWYAFWLYTDRMEEGSVGSGATDGAELDIVEIVPKPGELCMSVHWDGYGEELKSCCELTHVDKGFFDEYHELWYEWDQDGYRLYLDGTDEDCLLFDFPGSEEKYGDGTCAVPCDLVISAEFGTWGGDIDETQLPAHFYVDYVHAYTRVYGITYDYDGGALPEGAGNPAGYDAINGAELNAPVRTGSVFGGWYDNPGLNGKPMTCIPEGSTGDRTLYAKWLAPSLAGGRVTAPQGSVLILAEYDACGRLSALQCKTLDADALCAAPSSLGLTVPAEGEHRLLLVSKGSFAPLCKAYQSGQGH